MSLKCLSKDLKNCRIYGILGKLHQIYYVEDLLDTIYRGRHRLEITSPGKLPMGQMLTRMKEGYSKVRNEAIAHAFAYMNLTESWGSGIPRIIGEVKAAGLQEPEFIGGEVDLRINIYRGQIEVNNAKMMPTAL